MKYLLVLVVLLVAVHIWRRNRQEEQRTAAQADASRPRRPAVPAPMVACALCGTHLPASEAVRGRSAVYCCPAHRQQAEQGID